MPGPIHLASCRNGRVHEMPAYFMALWRDGLVQEVRTQPLQESIVVGLQHLARTKGDVLLEASARAPARTVTDGTTLQMSCGQLLDHVANHMLYVLLAAGDSHLAPSPAAGAE